MRFNENSNLDVSQVEDRRGSGGGVSLRGGGIAVGGGLGLVILVLALLFGVNPGDLLGSGTSADYSPSVDSPAANRNLAAECRTGADANNNEDCRIVGYVDSIQKYW